MLVRKARIIRVEAERVDPASRSPWGRVSLLRPKDAARPVTGCRNCPPPHHHAGTFLSTAPVER